MEKELTAQLSNDRESQCSCELEKKTSLFSPLPGCLKSPHALEEFLPDFFYHLAEPANFGVYTASRFAERGTTDEACSDRGQRAESGAGPTPDRQCGPAQWGHHSRSVAHAAPITRPALPPSVVPSDWYRFLNGFVFLWATQERLRRHLAAFRKRSQTLLVFDAVRLIKGRGDDLLLSPINSGNAMRRAAPRSYELFVPYPEWREKGWPVIGGQVRSKSTVPAEIAIRKYLPLTPYLLEVREC